jgi:ADP-heptose:LPS heptosyltransferase
MDDVEIDWVAAKTFAPLVRACPVVDNVLEFDRHGSVASFGRLCGEIRQKKYDWALDLQGLARSALMLAAARATQKARRADGREGAGLLCRHKPDLPPKGSHAHAVDILLQFLPLLGCQPNLAPDPLEFLHPAEMTWPVDLAARAPVVMFPDSRVKKKEWPGFYELTLKLMKERPDLTIVWAGSNGPEPELDWPETRFVNLLGRTKLDALPELIGMARLVICNDSGPLHLSAAMHRPVIGLFGPTDQERFGPYPLNKPRHTIIRAPEGKLDKLSTDVVLMEVVKGLRG